MKNRGASLLLLARVVRQHRIERFLAKKLRKLIASVFGAPIKDQGAREIAGYYLERIYVFIRRYTVEAALEAAQYGANRAVYAAQQARKREKYRDLPEDVRAEVQSEVGKYADNYYQYLERQLEKDSDAARIAYLRKTPDLFAREVIVYATSRGEYEENLRIGNWHTWISQADERVRNSHNRVHGETVRVGEKFSNGCRYPHDPEAPPNETYGCRCRIRTARDQQGG